MNKRKIIALSMTLLCGLLMVGGGVWAMSSGNYAINWNVIGAGGEPASSDDYDMRGTIGQPAAEKSSSANYDLGSGYWYPLAPAQPPEEPTIGFGPTSFNFSATEGGANPADEALDVWNSGADTLDWSITDDADWLSLSPETGSSTGPADVTEVTVSVDISGMTNSSYTATITISDPAATNSPQMVPVNLTINPAGDQDNPDVATGLDSISDCLVVVYAFDNATKTWSWYNPSWPPGANTLTTLYMGSGYWINVSEGCDFLTYGANTYELYEGWNLIGWLGYQEHVGDNPDVAIGLDTIGDWLVVVYGFDNATKTWTWYNPSWPPGANTLDTLDMGSGYWINVSEVCDLTYEANTYELYEDWNLIGWLGW